MVQINETNSNSINLRQKEIIKKNNLEKKRTKIKNAMHEVHEETLELYEEEQIQKDQGNRALSKRWKNLFKKRKISTILVQD